MLPLFTRAEARAYDQHAMHTLGVAGLVLMENAGAGAARIVCDEFPSQLGRVLCVGGTGQNGGDAWVVARHLSARGLTPTCVLIGTAASVRGDAAPNLAALRALGCSVHAITDAAALVSFAHAATLIIDGLFGTGLDRAVTGLHAACIRVLGEARAPVLALDLPSGIDADTGQVLGEALRAQVTVTFAARKRGLYQHPGRAYAGEIRVVDLGVPLACDAALAQLIDAHDVVRALPLRAAAGHKGSHGHVLLFAGSGGKTGAAMLASLGALRGGAGLVTVATDADTQRALDAKTVEAMTHVLDGSFEAASGPAFDALCDASFALAHGKKACLVGPGFGLTATHRALAIALAEGLPAPSVLDADALTALADSPERLRRAAGPRVLTPHPGEAARLLGCDTGAIALDRHRAAAELAQRTGHVVVLKGAGTVIASPDGRIRVCERGSPALGSGGTGDVLAGLCTALLVELPAFEAAFAAVELHARAGELAAQGDRGLLASEVAHALPRALGQCRTAAP